MPKKQKKNNPNSNKVISCLPSKKNRISVFKKFIPLDNFISIDIFGTQQHTQQSRMTRASSSIARPMSVWVKLVCVVLWEASGILRVSDLHRTHPHKISRMNGAEEFLHNIFMMEIPLENCCKLNGVTRYMSWHYESSIAGCHDEHNSE